MSLRNDSRPDSSSTTTTACAQLTYTAAAADISDRKVIAQRSRIEVSGAGARTLIFALLAILMGIGVAILGPIAAIVPIVIDGAHQTTAVFEFVEHHRS